MQYSFEENERLLQRALELEVVLQNRLADIQSGGHDVLPEFTPSVNPEHSRERLRDTTAAILRLEKDIRAARKLPPRKPPRQFKKKPGPERSGRSESIRGLEKELEQMVVERLYEYLAQGICTNRPRFLPTPTGGIFVDMVPYPDRVKAHSLLARARSYVSRHGYTLKAEVRSGRLTLIRKTS